MRNSRNLFGQRCRANNVGKATIMFSDVTSEHLDTTLIYLCKIITVIKDTRIVFSSKREKYVNAKLRVGRDAVASRQFWRIKFTALKPSINAFILHSQNATDMRWIYFGSSDAAIHLIGKKIHINIYRNIQLLQKYRLDAHTLIIY